MIVIGILYKSEEIAYVVLGVLLQLKWQYLQRNVPGVGTLKGPIEEALRDKFFPALFGGEEINDNFRKILGHCIKHGVLGIPDPQLLAESVYNTSKAASGELVDYLLVGTSLNYVGHRICVHRASAGTRKDRKHVEMEYLDRLEELADGQDRNRLRR